MNDVVPLEIVETIYRDFDFFSAPVSIREKLLEIAKLLMPHISDLVLAEEIFGQNLQEYVSLLQKKQKEIQKDAGVCSYEILLDNEEIIGFSYPRLNDSPIMRSIRLVAPAVSDALHRIRELSPEEFEIFCSKILILLDAEDAITTKVSRDEGIDFLGWLCIPGTFLSVENIQLFRKEFRMLVIGQAKRYKPENPVGVGAIRELVGTVAAFHHDQLAPWPSRLQLSSFKLMSPILPLMMTTGRISQDAKKLSEKCGVIVRDGAEIALFICLEKVGLSEIEENGVLRYRFDEEKFVAWLNNTET